MGCSFESPKILLLAGVIISTQMVLLLLYRTSPQKDTPYTKIQPILTKSQTNSSPCAPPITPRAYTSTIGSPTRTSAYVLKPSPSRPETADRLSTLFKYPVDSIQEIIPIDLRFGNLGITLTNDCEIYDFCLLHLSLLL
jgi:hypothetical protein